VNAVNPTLVNNKMGRRVFSDPAFADFLTARHPLGKIAGNN